jgi:DNA-binding transcriptional LysR family regulator
MANQDAVITGNVRVTTVSTIANHILIPARSQLRSRHPALCLELISENTNFSITRREADIAVRFARPSKDDGMLCQRVGEIEYAVFTAAGTSPDDSLYKTRGRTNTFGGQRWEANLACCSYRSGEIVAPHFPEKPFRRPSSFPAIRNCPVA